MKLKNLKKKIRRLETRLKEGPKKLAKLKRKFEAQVAANKTRKESAARAAVVRRARSATAKPKRPATAKAAGRAGAAKKSARPKKAKRKLNLSPERRAELAEMMRARWAAKRAAAAAASQPPPSELPPDGDFRIDSAPQRP